MVPFLLALLLTSKVTATTDAFDLPTSEVTDIFSSANKGQLRRIVTEITSKGVVAAEHY